MATDAGQRILVLDDDADWLNLCREILSQLPSKPEIHTATSGMQGLALLDAQPFRVLLCDLVMPRMDGLQVLSIVRRRFPGLRTVVLTGHPDEAFRSRAYALGVELFWLKSDLQQNSQLFLECVESLLGEAEEYGFRDAQSKSILDVIQMELALRNSGTLRIKSGEEVGHIWIENGRIVDAQAEKADGELALGYILHWKGGTYESLPGESGRARTINKSLEVLLIEFGQALVTSARRTAEREQEETKFISRVTAMACEGADFVVTIPVTKEDTAKGFGNIQDTGPLADWARQAETAARRLGAKFGAGPLTHVAANNLERHLLLLPDSKGRTLVIGWPPKADPARLFEQSKKLAETWAS